MRIGFDVSPLARPHPLGVERAARELAAALERRGQLELVRLAPPLGARPLFWRQHTLPRLCTELGLAGFHSTVSAFPLRARVPCVATVHELPWRHGAHENAGFRHHFWARSGAQRAARIVVPSEFVARDLAAETPSVREHVRVVPWAASAAFTPHGSAWSSTRPFVVCPGGARPKKAAERVLAALDELERTRGVALDLVVTGTRARERTEAASRLASTRVRFTDVLVDAELAAVYRAARAVVLAAPSEGFGLPALEALACGAPAVVRVGTAPAELAGDAALTVDVDDVRALADAIARAHAERDVWRELGPRRASAFTWDASAARVETLWRELAT